MSPHADEKTPAFGAVSKTSFAALTGLALAACSASDTGGLDEPDGSADVSVAAPECGNGIVEAREVCDDGNTDNFSGDCLGDCSAFATASECGGDSHVGPENGGRETCRAAVWKEPDAERRYFECSRGRGENDWHCICNERTSSSVLENCEDALVEQCAEVPELFRSRHGHLRAGARAGMRRDYNPRRSDLRLAERWIPGELYLDLG